jgi:hypothetical protein
LDQLALEGSGHVTSEDDHMILEEQHMTPALEEQLEHRGMDSPLTSQPTNGDHVTGQQSANGDHVISQPVTGQQSANGDHMISQPANGDHVTSQPVNGDHVISQPANGDHVTSQPVNGDRVMSQQGNGNHVVIEELVSLDQEGGEADMLTSTEHSITGDAMQRSNGGSVDSAPTDDEVIQLWSEHYNSYYWYCYYEFMEQQAAAAVAEREEGRNCGEEEGMVPGGSEEEEVVEGGEDMEGRNGGERGSEEVHEEEGDEEVMEAIVEGERVVMIGGVVTEEGNDAATARVEPVAESRGAGEAVDDVIAEKLVLDGLLEEMVSSVVEGVVTEHSAGMECGEGGGVASGNKRQAHCQEVEGDQQLERKR